ncbi:MAG: pirin family protein [Acidimicrobiales bacterium]
MSGPVLLGDAHPTAEVARPSTACVEVSADQKAIVGRMTVRRALPRRGRRTVGPWCFADHIGPAGAGEQSRLEMGPHPHIGLQTVTWLLEGSTLHRDGLGSEQMLLPGELSLMTAGAGVAHSEASIDGHTARLHGVQLWVAQPEATRHGPAAFEHHSGLPRFVLGVAEVTVLVGELNGTRSDARHDSPIVGADLAAGRGESTIPLRKDFEHALMVLSGAVTVGRRLLVPGTLGYLGLGRDELLLRTSEPTRALLIGGAPFLEPLLMWWNFVARDQAEMARAYSDWTGESERFAPFDSPLERVPAPAPFWSADRQ